MRSATCALSGCHVYIPLSLSSLRSSSALHLFVVRSTRYAVLYGLPVSLSTSANRFWRDRFLSLAFSVTS